MTWFVVPLRIEPAEEDAYLEGKRSACVRRSRLADRVENECPYTASLLGDGPFSRLMAKACRPLAAG